MINASELKLQIRSTDMLHLTRRSIAVGLRPLYHRPLYNMSFRKKWMEEMTRRSEELNRQKQLNRSQKEKQLYETAEENLTQDQKKVIQTYKVDKVWNLLLKESPDHNFQKEIILHKKAFEQTTKQLRSAILFEDLLRSQIDILIYDTKGKPYAHFLMKLLYIVASLGAAYWSVQAFRNHDPKNGILLDKTTVGKITKYTIYTLIFILSLVVLVRYKSFVDKYVETVVYNTEKQELTFVKRSLLGFRYNYVASRFKILYTENRFLNEKGTNYFDIDTKEQFSIAYKDSWIKQDLFSHLISQRIKI